jgi:hypothetical protein
VPHKQLRMVGTVSNFKSIQPHNAGILLRTHVIIPPQDRAIVTKYFQSILSNLELSQYGCIVCEDPISIGSNSYTDSGSCHQSCQKVGQNRADGSRSCLPACRIGNPTTGLQEICLAGRLKRRPLHTPVFLLFFPLLFLHFGCAVMYSQIRDCRVFHSMDPN